MCLDLLNDDIEVKSNFGWKIFNQVGEDRYKSPIFHTVHFNPFTSEIWYFAEQAEVFTDDDDEPVPYTAGFHIFLDKHDAEIYQSSMYPSHLSQYETITIKKVEFEGILAKGIDYGGQVVVAEKMKICA